MKKPFFTIIVVSYNAGARLLETIKSIKMQTFVDYKVLVKDGMSTDGSIDKLKELYKDDGDITITESCDHGIYHAMNIATNMLKENSSGEDRSYIFFLNCGDTFKDENVLRRFHEAIVERQKKDGTTIPAIFYGDIFEKTTGFKVSSNPEINDYACYRNLPSHQACFYDERLIFKYPFDLKYKVRADYDQFLKCFYLEKADTVYVPIIVTVYEGGGYSDQNKKISEDERKKIIKNYLPSKQIRKYDLLRVVTLSGLRGVIASNKLTAGAYNGVKSAIYKAKGNKKEKKD